MSYALNNLTEMAERTNTGSGFIHPVSENNHRAEDCVGTA